MDPDLVEAVANRVISKAEAEAEMRRRRTSPPSSEPPT
jgi:hypothetical protein